MSWAPQAHQIILTPPTYTPEACSYPSLYSTSSVSTFLLLLFVLLSYILPALISQYSLLCVFCWLLIVCIQTHWKLRATPWPFFLSVLNCTWVSGRVGEGRDEPVIRDQPFCLEQTTFSFKQGQLPALGPFGRALSHHALPFSPRAVVAFLLPPFAAVPWQSFSPFCSLLFEASVLAALLSLCLSKFFTLLLPVLERFMISASKILVLEKDLPGFLVSFGWGVHHAKPESGAEAKLRLLLDLSLLHSSVVMFPEVSQPDVKVMVWNKNVLFWLFCSFCIQNKANVCYYLFYDIVAFS